MHTLYISQTLNISVHCCTIGCELCSWLVSYRYVPMTALKHLMQASGTKEAQHLSLLMGAHAGKHHSILQHCLKDGQILLLQKVLKGSSCDGALGLSLCYTDQRSGGFMVLPNVSCSQQKALTIALQGEVR